MEERSPYPGWSQLFLVVACLVGSLSHTTCAHLEWLSSSPRLGLYTLVPRGGLGLFSHGPQFTYKFPRLQLEAHGKGFHITAPSPT